MGKSYRFLMFHFGFFTGLFDPRKLNQAVAGAAKGGYRLLRREISVEPRRVLLLLKALALGMVFEKDEAASEPEYLWKMDLYKTRLLTRTVDPRRMEAVLNKCAEGGYELFFAVKYFCRFLLVFPREAYFLGFRRPAEGESRVYRYGVKQIPYRFFSRTLDPGRYMDDLNRYAGEGQLKITFRDERRILGLFKQPTVISIWEQTS